MMRILSLGAGVQSSAVFLLACRGYWDHRIDCAIFADTGWEPPGVYRWLDEVLRPEGEKAGIPIHIVSQGNIKEDALRSQVRGAKTEGGGDGRLCPTARAIVLPGNSA